MSCQDIVDFCSVFSEFMCMRDFRETVCKVFWGCCCCCCCQFICNHSLESPLSWGMKSASLCFVEENAYDLFNELMQGHSEETEESRKCGHYAPLITTARCSELVRYFLPRL